MNYSICLLDASGRTQGSEVMAFASDDEAMHFAGSQLPDYAIVEVWNAFDLVRRLFREPDLSAVSQPVAGPPGRKGLAAWENEGGALA